MDKKIYFILFTISQIYEFGHANIYEMNDRQVLKCGIDVRSKVENHPVFIELENILNIPSNLLISTKHDDIQEDVRIAAADDISSTADFPWIAQIRFSAGEISMYMCGAVIISEFFVLTSARCASRSLPINGIVRVGDFNVEQKDEFEKDYRIKAIATSNEGKAISNKDIALVNIKADSTGQGIVFSDFVLPVCLPTAFTPYLKSMLCSIGGYGRDEYFKESRYLKKGTLPLLDRKTCRRSTGTNSYLEEGIFCAGGIPWASTGCSGDKGSPIICTVDGRSTVFGIDSISGCNTASKVGYYADVQYHLPWIAAEIKRLSAL